MIIQRLPDTLRVIYQTDHAALSGQFAANWGNATYAPPIPRPSVQIAATRHDDGWKFWEASPKVDSVTGRPQDFLSIDVHEHMIFYRKGIAQVTTADPYAGLLVNMHGCGIYNGRYGMMDAPGQRTFFTSFFLEQEPSGLDRYSEEERRDVKAFIAEHEARQGVMEKRLCNTGPTNREVFDQQLWINYQLLQVWDRLSLYFCMHDLAVASPLVLHSTPYNYSGQTLTLRVTPQNADAVTLSPYPFASSPLTFTLVMRDIPDRVYTSDSDLQETLQTTTPQLLAFRVLVGSPDYF